MDTLDSESFYSSPTPKVTEIPQDLLRCPVCYSIPKENLNLFQCKNGHIICESCYKCLSVSECPSCRISLEDMIRNRQLEKIRQYVIEQCPNVERGCGELVQRKDLQEHWKHCQFRPMHFCKAIGFTDCDYDITESPSNPERVVDHLTTTHLTDIDSVILGNDLYHDFDFHDLFDNAFIRLFQSRASHDTSTFFLLIMKSSSETEGILVQCLCIGKSESDAANYKVGFYFTSTDVQKCVACWNTPWYKECISNEFHYTTSTSYPQFSSKSFWSGAYHISKRTLTAIQGEDLSIRLTVKIKEKDES